jgi:hypothetical protein
MFTIRIGQLGLIAFLVYCGSPVQASATVQAPGDSLTYTGRVVEHGTGKPIKGATATVTRFIWPDPATGGRRILQETKHQSDAAGKYRFTTTADQLAEPQLAVYIRVEHPDYPTDGAYYYEFGKIQPDGAEAGHTSLTIEVPPGKPITGAVETPDGKPAAGVIVRCFSYLEPAGANPGGLVMGRSAETRTDAQGRFRLVALTPGKVYLKLLPAAFAVSIRELDKSERGDIGRLVLRKGTSLTGTVRDADGTPLAGVIVNAAGFPREPKTDALYDDSHWDNSIDSFSRSSVTGPNGEFTLAPLPPGFYRLLPVTQDDNLMGFGLSRPLPAPFTPLRARLKDGETPGPLEIRAHPHVAVEAQFNDSKRKPRQGPVFFLVGRIDVKKPGGEKPPDNLFGLDDAPMWMGMGWPDPAGKIVFHAPRGLRSGAIYLDHLTDEYHALRYRIGKQGPLRGDQQVNLGLLSRDIKDIEIVCYESPTIFVRAVARDGSKPKGMRITAVYPDSRVVDIVQTALNDSTRSDVEFREQADGRFQSLKLLPDESVTVTVSADGLQPRSETVKLPERATRELELVLERK